VEGELGETAAAIDYEGLEREVNLSVERVALCSKSAGPTIERA
jgi:hypothetical protein